MELYASDVRPLCSRKERGRSEPSAAIIQEGILLPERIFLFQSSLIMSLLRSTCILGRLAGAVHSQPLRIPSTQIRCVTMKVTHGQTVVKQSFEERNASLKRPLSPHLTIYAPQLTSMMSISYRISGMALSVYAVALAGASFMTSDVAQLAQSITAMGIPTAVLFPLKFMLALPATYHIFNGIRHLAWDSGKFFTIKNVYTGGYITLAATFISAFYLAM